MNYEDDIGDILKNQKTSKNVKNNSNNKFALSPISSCSEDCRDYRQVTKRSVAFTYLEKY